MSSADQVMTILLQKVAEDIADLKAKQDRMNERMEALVRLDAEHGSTRSDMAHTKERMGKLENEMRSLRDSVPDRLDDRLRQLEGQSPITKLTTGWVLSAVVGIAALAASFVWGRIVGGG